MVGFMDCMDLWIYRTTDGWIYGEMHFCIFGSMDAMDSMKSMDSMDSSKDQWMDGSIVR
jgi:hypothetical protein